MSNLTTLTTPTIPTASTSPPLSLLYNNTQQSVLWLNLASRSNAVFVSSRDYEALAFFFPIFVTLCQLTDGQAVACPQWILNNQDNTVSYALGGYLYRPTVANGAVHNKIFTVDFFLLPTVVNGVVTAFELVAEPVAALQLISVTGNDHTIQAVFAGLDGSNSNNVVSLDFGDMGKYYLTDWPRANEYYGLRPLNVATQHYSCSVDGNIRVATAVIGATAVTTTNLACNCSSGLICSSDEAQLSSGVSFCRPPDCRELGCSVNGFECRQIGLNSYQCVYNPAIACTGICSGLCFGTCPQGQICTGNSQGIHSCVSTGVPAETNNKRWLWLVLILLLIMLLVFAVIWIVLANKKKQRKAELSAVNSAADNSTASISASSNTVTV